MLSVMDPNEALAVILSLLVMDLVGLAMVCPALRDEMMKRGG